jgi:hypothetical protein
MELEIPIKEVTNINVKKKSLTNKNLSLTPKDQLLDEIIQLQTKKEKLHEKLHLIIKELDNKTKLLNALEIMENDSSKTILNDFCSILSLQPIKAIPLSQGSFQSGSGK